MWSLALWVTHGYVAPGYLGDLWLCGPWLSWGLWLTVWSGAIAGTQGRQRGLWLSVWAPAVAGTCGCWWSVGLEVLCDWGWGQSYCPAWAPSACCPCFLPRLPSDRRTVLSEVPFPAARFPLLGRGSTEACDKCLHIDPLQLSAFAVGARPLPTC